MIRYADMHIHLDLMARIASFVQDAQQQGLALLACTVTPANYQQLAAEHGAWSGHDNVVLAAGAHPWWIADGRIGGPELAALIDSLSTCRFVGEIGLDFSRRTPADSHERQCEALRLICRAAAQTSDPDQPRVLSLHSIQSARTVLEILDETGCLERCRCIYHWFSASTPELWEAIEAGCWFSVGLQSVSTGRGREYAKLIPKDRLLLETDYPPHESWTGSAQEISEHLQVALDAINTQRKADMGQQILANSREVLGLDPQEF